MYQIVFTSEFIRNLKESTLGTAPAAAPAEPLLAPAAAPAPAPRGLAALGALVFGSALRLLGAH